MEQVLSESASASPLLPAVPGGTALFCSATKISLLFLMSSLDSTCWYLRNKKTKSNKPREYLASTNPETTKRQGEHEILLQFRGEVKCESDVEEIAEYLLAVAKPLAAFFAGWIPKSTHLFCKRQGNTSRVNHNQFMFPKVSKCDTERVFSWLACPVEYNGLLLLFSLHCEYCLIWMEWKTPSLLN